MIQKRYRIVFFGTPEFALPALQSLIDSEIFEVVAVVTQPDKPVGRKQEIVASPIKLLAKKNAIAVLQPAKIKKNAEFIDTLIGLNADANVVVAYGKILPQTVLDAAKYGSINVHGSKLPKYRGASPITQAIINGDKNIQVTVQKMVFEMDEGPIIAYGPGVQIAEDDTTGTLSAKLAATVPAILPDSLVAFLGGDIVLTPQDDSQASYVKLINKEDGLIDWSDDELEIERKIRAYNPWPIAYTMWNELPVKIISAEYVTEVENDRGNPAKIEKDLFIGKLRIDKLQLPGKKPMSGRDFANGYAQFLGTKML